MAIARGPYAKNVVCAEGGKKVFSRRPTCWKSHVPRDSNLSVEITEIDVDRENMYHKYGKKNPRNLREISYVGHQVTTFSLRPYITDYSIFEQVL